jgi:hypothetical protein
LRKFVHSAFAIDLKFMPTEATRHKHNKTRFNRNANLVIWSLELVFDLGAASPVVKIHTKTNLFHSNETLKALLARFHRIYSKSLFQVDLSSSSSLSKHSKEKPSQLTESESQSLLLVFDAFKKHFQHVSSEDESSDNLDVQDLNVLIEETKPGRRTYVKLSLDQRLDECLQRRTIIEYPTLFVVTAQDLHKYPLNSVAEVTNGQKRGPSSSEIGQEGSSIAKQPRPASTEPIPEPKATPPVSLTDQVDIVRSFQML